MQVARRISTWHDGGGEPAYWGLCFTAEEDGATVSMSSTGTLPTVTLESSFDGKTWTSFSPAGDTPVTLASAGDRVYFRAGAGGNTAMGQSGAGLRKFVLTGRIAASGNIMSLLDGEDSENTVLGSAYSFFRLFDNCTSLTAAPDLPATTLLNSCYRRLFYGCTSLTAAPELPANEISPYCYDMMFYGCTSLTAAPKELPAIATRNGSYRQMFFNCTSLTAAPKINITEIISASFVQFFKEMFSGCRSLSSIEVAFSTWEPTSTMFQNWVASVAPTGVFKCPATLGTNETIERGTNRCPNGWTVVNI